MHLLSSCFCLKGKSGRRPLCTIGGFEKSRLKKKIRLLRTLCSSRPHAFRGPLCSNPLAPVVEVSFGVRPLLPPAGAIQLFQPLLRSQNFSAGVVPIARVEIVLGTVIVLLHTYDKCKKNGN